MAYFWINIGIHFAITLALLLLLFYTVRMSMYRKWKKGFLFLAPTLVAIILLIQVSAFSIPRLLDFSDVLRSTYRVTTGRVERVSDFKNYIVIDGKEYYVNPFDMDIKEGDRITVKYTKYAHYSAEIEVLKDTVE